MYYCWYGSFIYVIDLSTLKLVKVIDVNKALKSILERIGGIEDGK